MDNFLEAMKVWCFQHSVKGDLTLILASGNSEEGRFGGKLFF